jgi:hypothetical protein|tara:strand:- start:1491 stop:1889 length:399 start_codon:yes stop_codon:yes gene_type:complete
MKKDQEQQEPAPTQYIIKDTASALKMKKIEAKESNARYKAIVQKTKFEQKLEIQKLKLTMSAKEAASKHIAIFGPLYLMLLVAGFLCSIQFIPVEQVSVVSALLTLLVTMIGSNLRSIVSEGAGEENGNGKH